MLCLFPIDINQKPDKKMSKPTPAAKPGTQKKDASDLQQKSPAEFFAENKNIAGFDNVSTAEA